MLSVVQVLKEPEARTDAPEADEQAEEQTQVTPGPDDAANLMPLTWRGGTEQRPSRKEDRTTIAEELPYDRKELCGGRR